jgi:hypothetical protein
MRGPGVHACILTPNMPLIHTSFTSQSFFEIPPSAKKAFFVTEFLILCKNPSFYEVNLILPKRLCAWRNFKNIFSRPLFTIILRPKKVNLVHIRFEYESVAY